MPVWTFVISVILFFGFVAVSFRGGMPKPRTAHSQDSSTFMNVTIVKMAYYVITGKHNCLNCAHAVHVADQLSKKLPKFLYRTIMKSEEDWPTWLDQINSMNNWHEIRSPVIWKEVSGMGGKAHLIGGLGEFWEYCYDYYGFESRMSKDDLQRIIADNAIINSSKAETKMYYITIHGASNYSMLQFIIYELQHCFEFKSNEVMLVKLYDHAFGEDHEQEEIILGIVDDYKNILVGYPQALSVVTSISDSMENCDLLIVIDDYSRQPKEDIDSWLDRCKKSMVILADDINMYAKRDLKVVLNHFGPVCFNASVLMEYCTIVKLHNIVAVTADEGISLISMMVQKTDELVENFWCPPVWGFCGIMSYVSLSTTAITTQVYRPYKRALKIKENSALPKGEYQDEIRLLGSRLSIDDALYEEIEYKKEKEQSVLNRNILLPKIRALGSLLKLWFAEEIGDEIISLGICSNGAFHFPVGVCLSQPVCLNQRRVWQVFSGIPLHTSTEHHIESILLHIEATLKKFGLGERAAGMDDFD